MEGENVKPSVPEEETPPPPPTYSERVRNYIDSINPQTVDQFGRYEYNLKSGFLDSFKGLILTIPWQYMFFQALWTGAVVGAGYALGDKELSTFSSVFWDSRLSISSNVSFGIGWALFVFLGFFTSAASDRYFSSQLHIGGGGLIACGLVRQICQTYNNGVWHEKDFQRIISHLLAYPVCLKMELRGERDRKQLEPFLHKADVDDILNSQYMHIHCIRVIRAYVSFADYLGYMTNSEKKKEFAGFPPRFFIINVIDKLDDTASKAMRILNFQPSIGYVNHLRIYLYIWMTFLPLSLIKDSGWYTPIWSMSITYFVSMIFVIARALNEPFGFDVHDIKLNAMTRDALKDMIQVYDQTRVTIPELIDTEHETPTWLESTEPPKLESSMPPDSKGIRLIRMPFRVALWLTIYTIWTAIVIVSTWYVTRDDDRVPGSRWWSLYIPLTTNTTSFVSVGLFLLVGFWINDAYGRYWEGLQIWQTTLRPHLENIAVHFAVMHDKGYLHDRDVERIFSMLAAVPYVVKMDLRGDFSTMEQDLSEMLSPKDIQDLKNSVLPTFELFSMIFAYGNCASWGSVKIIPTLKAKGVPYIDAIFGVLYSTFAVEMNSAKCGAIKNFTIAPAFTMHLRLFTGFWLALLPLSVVTFGGFTSFAYLIPLGYAVINLLVLGDELCDPWGDDPNDIPLELFSKEIANSIHRIYKDTSNPNDIVQPKVEYNRELFQYKYFSRKPGAVDAINNHTTTVESQLSFKLLLSKILDFFPSVSIWAMLASILWTIAATFLSWRLSILWESDLNDNRKFGWESPIDVNASITGSLGFALFLILSFACSDGISRYQSSGSLLYLLKEKLSSLTSLTLKNTEDNSFHDFDKERKIAHLLQIPICLKNILLERNDSKEESFLCEKDYDRYINSSSKIDYLITLTQSYAIARDPLACSCRDMETKRKMTLAELFIMNDAASYQKVREVLKKALAVKRFPIVGSYKTNQRVFIAIWLMILPFTMTATAGFFTILAVPLIAYGIFGMQEIAERLVDPLGEDKIDVPVEELCDSIIKSMLQIANSSDWGCEYHIKDTDRSILDSDLSTSNSENSLEEMFKQESTPETKGEVTTMPQSGEKFNVDVKKAMVEVSDMYRKENPSFLSHLFLSVPWWQMLAVTVWTSLACGISYISRKQQFDGQVRWWVSFISIDTGVVAYMSTATFSLLGFFVRAAYDRYLRAGAIWTEQLRTTCHNMARAFLTISRYNTVHKKDLDRVIGHIIAVPLILKEQVRGSTDLSELNSYLTYEDIGRIQCSKDMIIHCLEVLRSYHYRIECYGEHSDFSCSSVSRTLQQPIFLLEDIVSDLKYLDEFRIPRGFLNLLNVLLLIWFIFLPFAIVNTSGWFTILWIVFISYSVLGIHAIAVEIQHPFGDDLNDFDLDIMAKRIVVDVISVKDTFKHNQMRPTPYMNKRSTPNYWATGNFKATNVNDAEKEGVKQSVGDFVKMKASNLKQILYLTFHIINWWATGMYLAWTGFAVSLSYLVHRVWPFVDQVEEGCSKWFCSRIAVSSSVMTYIGFALFLLLGFQIYDSHGRYERGIDTWQQNVLLYTRTATNRILGSMPLGGMHERDIQRVVGHLAAFPITLMGTLRGVDYKEKLLKVLDPEDVEAILSSPEKADYCYDVIFSYVFESFRQKNCSTLEQVNIFALVNKLQMSISDCHETIKTPMLYGYVQHLRIFIAIYLILLPFGLVESSGWVAILWCMFIAYGTFGAEQWAEELANPFGDDLSDIPLDDLCDSILKAIKENYDYFKNNFVDIESRFNDLIIDDRIID